jgi:trehalose 6-phosphate phosphatase
LAPTLAQLFAPDLSPDRDAYLFDFDGTLVDIAPSPDTVAVPADMPELMRAIGRRTGGAAAVVSGRSLPELERFLPELELPMVGEHGAAIRLPGCGPAGAPPSDAALPLDDLNLAIADFARTKPGLLVERKPRSVALHYRLRPELASAVSEFTERLAALNAPAIVLQPGKMVAEMRLAGPDKGDAVSRLMQLPVFRGRRPVYFGDDATDEAAFAAAAMLGGAGVRVGGTEARTRATALVSTPEDLRALLRAIACR